MKRHLTSVRRPPKEGHEMMRDWGTVTNTARDRTSSPPERDGDRPSLTLGRLSSCLAEYLQVIDEDVGAVADTGAEVNFLLLLYLPFSSETCPRDKSVAYLVTLSDKGVRQFIPVEPNSSSREFTLESIHPP
jgi:hypothetical protein